MTAAALADRVGTVTSRGDFDVPALGEAVVQLIIETRRPDSDARTIAAIIRRDAALAANLIKLANSARYAGREPVTTLPQLVARLGTVALRDLAVATAAKTRAFRVDGFEVEMRALFAHAFATALYAQEVARVRRRGVEEAFLAGLFHDVGKPLVLQLCSELAGADDRAAMLQVADDLHAEVGARAIASWGLGTGLADAVRHHHDFAGDAARTNGAVVAFAAALADHALAPATERGAFATVVRGHAAVPHIGLYPDDVERLIAAAPAVAEQLGAAA